MIVVQLVGVLVNLRVRPVIHIRVLFFGGLGLRRKHKLEHFVADRNLDQ